MSAGEKQTTKNIYKKERYICVRGSLMPGFDSETRDFCENRKERGKMMVLMSLSDVVHFSLFIFSSCLLYNVLYHFAMIALQVGLV